MRTTIVTFLFSLNILLNPLLSAQAQPSFPPNPLAGTPGDLAQKELRQHWGYLNSVEDRAYDPSARVPDPAAEWKGMDRFDILECVRLVIQAQVVEIRGAGNTLRAIWVKDARGYKKANGWYGLKINGKPVNEGEIYMIYGLERVNLQTVFSYRGKMIDPNTEWIR